MFVAKFCRSFLLPVSIVWVMVVSASASAQIGGTVLPDFASLVKSNSPAVVNISTDQLIKKPELPDGVNPDDVPDGSQFDDFLKKFLEDQPSRDAKSLGSGFIISSDGVIMTSAHVIEDAKRIIVRLPDRREMVGKVIGLDRKSDVAVIKIDAENLTTVTIGNPNDLDVGEWVLAIGSPFGFESSATAGIVSAKGRSLPNENYVPFIQTDVAINPGNSGGPLFNLRGEVIGVNAQIYSRTGGFMGLSFAVPIDLAMRIGDQLRDSGRVSRGWLGVAIQDVSPEMAESLGMLVPRGALITEVLGDGPAADSDLKAGDVVVAFNDIPIENMAQLPPVVGQTAVETSVEVDVVRDSEPLKIRVTVGELPTDEQLAESSSSEPAVPDSGEPGTGDESSATEPKEPSDSESGTTTDPDEPQDLKDIPATVPQSGKAPSLKELGLTVEPVYGADGESANAPDASAGLRVTAVESGAGMRAGVREGDVLVALGDRQIRSVDQFVAMAREARSDDSPSLKVMRGSQELFLLLK